MIPLMASAIAQIVGGVLYGSDIEVTQPPVLNSNLATPGSMCLALVGEKVDGHLFVGDAFVHGAVLALVSRQVEERCIVVPDVTKALGLLAMHIRDQLPKLIVIGITGSQGKTTTKDLLTHLLSSVASTIAPIGNFNNELGVPLTLLQCTTETKYCILEMGARHEGDIRALCQISRPNIGVVLKVGSAHLGEFGSVEAIARTKSELIASLDPDAIAILGLYDSFTPDMARLHEGKIIYFGETSKAQVRAADIEVREGRAHFDLVTPQGRAAVGLRIVGLHQISNALAVAAIGSALALPLDLIAGSLSTAQMLSKWRMEIHELDDLLLINDAYNASPESMEAALRVLALYAQERGGQSWAFLGKMHELGESSTQEHGDIGTLALELGIDHLVCVGAPEYGLRLRDQHVITVHVCDNMLSAQVLARNISRGDVILVKASRSEKLEELASSIERQWQVQIEMQAEELKRESDS